MSATCVLVLGASSGIGNATCEEFARKGERVVGVHFDPAEGQERAGAWQRALREQGAEVELFNLNAASADTRTEICNWLSEQGLCVRVFVHSLAFGTLPPLVSAESDCIREQQLNMTMQVMAHSLVFWTRDLLRKRLFDSPAHIVAMTSAGSSRAAPSYGAVSAAKAALESHVRQLALELADHRISVNAIRAGVTRTPAFQKIPGSAEIAQRALAMNPHHRLTLASEVAGAIRTLASQPSDWITGNVVNVDGGEFVCS